LPAFSEDSQSVQDGELGSPFDYERNTSNSEISGPSSLKKFAFAAGRRTRQMALRDTNVGFTHFVDHIVVSCEELSMSRSALFEKPRICWTIFMTPAPVFFSAGTRHDPRIERRLMNST
jgi:hypothetical protein